MLITAVDTIAREATLFAAIWFLVGGIDDLLVDLIYFARRFHLHILSRFVPPSGAVTPSAETPPGRIVVFVAAWDEARVIGRMLRTALARFDHDDYRIYVGTYPNDSGTIAAVADVAEEDPRVRLVIGCAPGPTTKADCLNTLWRALLRDEASEGVATLGIALHDAEPMSLDAAASLILNLATDIAGRCGINCTIVGQHETLRFYYYGI